MVGFVSQADMPSQYRLFDVMAMPSLETESWIEQFGRVAVEAMASGVPVLASDSGSLPEVVGDAGVLVPPGDAGALASALQMFVDDPSELTRLADRARQRAEQYSWSNVARRQHDLYLEMLTGAG
jgi:glycosyltransferase involved in cell wall biosynthesis